MPKKVKNDMDDNFDFDTGGMSEFFPLEKPEKNNKPPKGTKGYLKNVAKSVFNLGVKVNKHLYPEVFDLGESIGIGSNNENRINVKGILADTNREIKKWSGIGKDLVKEVGKDAKEAIRTGYFVKTEDEAMDMDDMFGDVLGDDFEFDGESISFKGEDNFSLDDGGFGPDDDGDSTTGAKLDFGEAIVKSEYASTKAIVSSNAKMLNSTLSATQAHIKNEKLIFAQQMSVLQEHHVEKMGILRNIATNIGKNIEQGNISLRAQMEYSAKSLAFAQDTAAMVKEMRDSMWKMTKPEQKQEVDRKSLFGKVFGNGTGLNIKEWAKYYKGNAKFNAAGGIFDSIGMLPEMIETMAGMGMTPAQAIKSIAGGMITDTITDAFVNKDTRKKINAFNVGMRSLPGAINAKLGELADNPDKIENAIDRIPILGNFLNKHKWSGKAAELLSNQASYAHMVDNTTVLSEKYMMGDPNAVHPFDNKAHKVLTEVIPYQLSEINAGVNHKEAEYFDFKLNKFMPKSYMRTLTEQNSRNVIKGSMGYSDIENDFNTSLVDATKDEVNKTIEESDKPFYDENGRMITEMISAEFDRMLANLHRNQMPWTKETAEKIKKDEYYRDAILSGTSLELTSDQLKTKVAELFGKTLADQMTIDGDPEKAERNRYLRASGLSYAGDLSNMYAENEDRFAGMGNSIDYYSQMKSEDIKQELKKAEHELKKAKKRYNDNHMPTNLQKMQDAKKRVTELRQLAATTGYSGDVNTGINKGFDINNDKDFDFENFMIKSLDDSSEYGLIQNIYNLLLSGIDVYPKNELSAEHEALVFSSKHIQGQNKKRSITSVNTFQKSTEYEMVGTGAEINERLKEDGKDEDGKVENWRMSDEYRFTVLHHFHFYEYDDQTGKYNAVTGKLDPNKTYYRRVADVNADYNMTVKEQKMDRSDSIATSFLQKIPGVNKLYEGFNKVYGSVTDIASKTLGEMFYGEDYGEGNTSKDDINKAKETVKNKANDIKDNAKATGRKIKTYGEDIKKEAKETYEQNNSGIDTAIHMGKRIVKDIDKKTNISSIPAKLKKKIDNIRESDENLYTAIKTEFGEDKAIFKMIDELSKEEKELWNEEKKILEDLKNDPVVVEKIDMIVKKKNDVLDRIQSSKYYQALPEKKKEIFEKLRIEDKKNAAKNWSQKTKGKIDKFIGKIRTDERLNSMLDKGDKLAKSVLGSKAVTTAKEKINDAKDLANKTKQAIKDEKVKETFLKTDTAHKLQDFDESLMDEVDRYKQGIKDGKVKELIKEDAKKVKKGLKGIFRGRSKKSDEDDGIINSSAEMKQDREEKKRESLMEKMAASIAGIGAFFKKAEKDGLNLSDKTLDEIDDSNKEAAEKMADSVGDNNDGLVSGLLNKLTGGKFGDVVGKAGSAGGLLTKAGNALSTIGGAGTIGGTLAKFGTKLTGLAAGANNIGVTTLANVAKTAGTTVTSAGGAKGLIGRVGELISKLIKGITSKAGKGVSAAGNKIGDVLKKNITKFAPKLGGKLAAVTAAQVAIIAEIAAIVAGFTKGMYKAKEYFNVGKGMRISFGMKMAAGFGDALNAGLMGIPGLIAGLLGFPSVPLMFYEWCGGTAEKDALVRYQKFNGLRARILGVADPNALVAWENRSQNEGVGGVIKNGLNKGFRAIGSFLTGGIMMSNSEKDANMLGFQTTKIYDEWKTKKYDPIDQMRKTCRRYYFTYRC